MNTFFSDAIAAQSSAVMVGFFLAAGVYTPVAIVALAARAFKTPLEETA